MILEKRSARLCDRISTLINLNKEIWEQQRSEEHFTRLPYMQINSSTYIDGTPDGKEFRAGVIKY